MSSVDGLGQGQQVSNKSISTAEVMHAVYESTMGVDSLDQFQLGNFTQKQNENLHKALVDKGEALEKHEKEAFERGQPEKIIQTLKRIKKRVLADAKRNQLDAKRGADGLTQSKYRMQEADRSTQLPAELEGEGRLEGREDGRSKGRLSLADKPQLTGELLRMRGPMTEADQLRAAKQDLMHTIMPRPGARSAAGKAGQGVLAGAGANRDGAQQRAKDGTLIPMQLDKSGKNKPGIKSTGHVATASEEARLIGTAHTGRDFRDGFPFAGRSGEADKLPLMQFMSPKFLEALNKLGIRTLADFLVRGMFPEGRITLAKALGLPTTTLLLSILRAELFDLPVRPGKGKVPHTKDILLLAKLGAMTTENLAMLHRAVEKSPERLDLLTDLIALLQKNVPDWIGKERITKSALKEWLWAASSRGSEVQTSPGVPDYPVESAADEVISYFINNRWSDPDAAFDDAIVRMMILLREWGLRLDRQILERLAIERGEEISASYTKILAEVEAAWDAEVHEDERVRLERERIDDMYSEFVYEDDAWSILSDLHPWASPDEARADSLICFWMDPVPDYRHVMIDGQAHAMESLKPVYICLDPETGAVAPFGGGVG